MENNFVSFLNNEIESMKVIRITNIHTIPDTRTIADNISSIQSFLYDMKDRYDGSEKVRIAKISRYFEGEVEKMNAVIANLLKQKFLLISYIVFNYNEAIKNLEYWNDTLRRYKIYMANDIDSYRQFLVSQNGEINIVSLAEGKELPAEHSRCVFQ
jgi:hypothetical protein